MQPINVLNLIALAVVCIAIYHGVTILATKVKERDAKLSAREQERLGLFNEACARLARLNDVLEILVKSQVSMEMRLATESDRFSKSLESAASMSEKILTGTAKACEAIAVTTEKHRETVASLGKLLFGTGSGKDALTQPSEQDRDLLAAEMAYRAQGNSPGEARALAEAEIEREASFPGPSL